MTVKEFRKTTGLSQGKFAEYFEIPLNTIHCWEADENAKRRRNPPPYVLKLMMKVWDYEQDKRIEDGKKEAQKKFIEKILDG